MQLVAAITNAAHKHHLLRHRRLGLSTCTYIPLLSCQINVCYWQLSLCYWHIVHHMTYQVNVCIILLLFSVQIVCDSEQLFCHETILTYLS